MVHITYQEMVQKFGPVAAKGLLRVIEKGIRLNDNVSPIDAQRRLGRAFNSFSKQSVLTQD